MTTRNFLGKISSAKATPDFEYTYRRSPENRGDNLTLFVYGGGSNPLIPLGLPLEINYRYSLTIVPGVNPGEPTIRLSGIYDKFPGYEVYLKPKSGKQINLYSFPPKSRYGFYNLISTPFTTKKVSEISP